MRELGRLILTELIPLAGPILTTRQVGDAAQASAVAATRALRSLARNGLLANLSHGVWADVRHPLFSPYAVVPFLLARSREGAAPSGTGAKRDVEIDVDVPTATGGELGYVSFISALSLHGMLSQIPREIHVAVRTQRPRVVTPVATYEFHRLTPALFGGIESGDQWGRFGIATPSKAIVDTLYLSIHRGRQFAHLPELEIPYRWSEASLSVPEVDDEGALLERLARDVKAQIRRIPLGRVRTAMLQRWTAVHEAMKRHQNEFGA